MNQSVTIDVSKAKAQPESARLPLTLWQRRLTILFVVQLLLILGVFAYQQNARVQVDAKPLLPINANELDRVVIQDANSKVVIQKTDTEWQLPDLQNLPVERQKLDEILQKLEGTTLTWPVTTMATSHERFEVANSKYQRRIELFQGDTKKADFWLGSAPGFKKIHLRREGENQVYAVELSAFEFATTANDWLQKSLLALEDINSIKTADYELQKTGDTWSFVVTVPKSDTEKVNEVKTTELAKAIGNLQVQEVATQVPQGETKKVLVKSAAGEFEYDFVKTESDYFVKRNDRDIYFKLSQYEFERIAKPTKADLVIVAQTDQTGNDPVANIVEEVTQGVLNSGMTN